MWLCTVVILWSHSSVEFVVVIKVYGAWIKAIETSIGGEFVGSGGCGIIGKFCQRSPCLPAVWPIVAVDTQVLLACMHCSFTDSICLCVVGSGKA